MAIAHELNYTNLTSEEKDGVIFLVTSDGYLKINFTGMRIFYVGANSKPHANFRNIFLNKCAMSRSWANKNTLTGIEKQLGRVPFNRLYRYRIVPTFNRDDYWFDSHAYKITPSLSPLKKIKVAKNNIVQSTDLFRGLDYEKNFDDRTNKDNKKN